MPAGCRRRERLLPAVTGQAWPAAAAAAATAVLQHASQGILKHTTMIQPEPVATVLHFTTPADHVLQIEVMLVIIIECCRLVLAAKASLQLFSLGLEQSLCQQTVVSVCRVAQQ